MVRCMVALVASRANEIVGYIYFGNEGPITTGKVFDFGIQLLTE